MPETGMSVATQQAILYDALTPDRLELILFPTEQCNFRCTYCYEDFAKGRMSTEIISAVKALIDRRVMNLKWLHISWFGGEPMIAYDIVSDMMRYAHSRCMAAGIRFSAAATTNGYNLTKERFIELDRLNMQTYQISLDGAAEAHDQTRLRIDGAGTFGRIWKNIVAFDEARREGQIRNSSILLRLHVTPSNVESVHELASLIDEQLEPDGFVVHVKNVGHYGGKSDADRKVLNAWQPEYKEIEKRVYSKLSRFTPAFSDAVYVCYACKANSLSIRSDGTLNKCTVALNSESNRIGSVNLDGTLSIDNQKIQRWLKPLETMDKGALGCPVRHLATATS